MYLPLFVGFCAWSVLCYALLCALSSFAIILTSLLCFNSWCLVKVNVLWLFLTAVPWVGLQCVVVAFTDHTHLLLPPPLRYRTPIYNYIDTSSPVKLSQTG